MTQIIIAGSFLLQSLLLLLAVGAMAKMHYIMTSALN
jgi:hypothetical protein